MLLKKQILARLEDLQGEIAKRYKAERIGLFGSFIKGEQKDTSDIDILVWFKEDADLFDLLGLNIFLEEKLGRKVDVVSASGLRKELKKSILKEVAYI